MRLARPYPCCGPIVANVRKTINERVPSQTSVLSAMVSPIGNPYIPRFLWDCNRSWSVFGRTLSDRPLSSAWHMTGKAYLADQGRFGTPAWCLDYFRFARYPGVSVIDLHKPPFRFLLDALTCGPYVAPIYSMAVIQTEGTEWQSIGPHHLLPLGCPALSIV